MKIADRPDLNIQVQGVRYPEKLEQMTGALTTSPRSPRIRRYSHS